MRSIKTLSAIAAAVLLGRGLQAADQYTIDAGHATVGFSVKHMVISNVKGRFNEFSGEILFDAAAPQKSSVKVDIKAASIDTADSDRDAHLKNGDFLDVENHPSITFQSKSVKKTKAGYEVSGPLTIRGVTKDVTFPFQLNGPITDPWGNVRLGAEAALTINRKDFNVSWNKVLDNGGLAVGDEVKITLDIEAIKAKK